MPDASLRWSLDLSRFDAATRARIEAILRRMDKELTAALNQGNLTEWGTARAKQLMAEAKSLIEVHYNAAQATLFTQLSGMADAAVASVATVIAGPTLPTQTAMAALLSDVLIMGAPQKAWWARQAADVAFRFTAAVRQGMVAAETNMQIVKRVMGVLDVSRSNAAALVQTGVHAVANEARLATFRANSDVIIGLKWLATLDRHTCITCGERDGMSWKLDGAAINATVPFLNPPIHFNDRCVLSPITRLSELGNPQRASDAGPVSAKLTFEAFLERQGVGYQNQVLGDGRAQMWRDGKLTLRDLTSGTGRPLTLEQLKGKYP